MGREKKKKEKDWRKLERVGTGNRNGLPEGGSRFVLSERFMKMGMRDKGRNSSRSPSYFPFPFPTPLFLNPWFRPATPSLLSPISHQTPHLPISYPPLPSALHPHNCSHHPRNPRFPRIARRISPWGGESVCGHEKEEAWNFGRPGARGGGDTGG